LASAARASGTSSSREAGLIANPFGQRLSWRVGDDGIVFEARPGCLNSLRLAFAAIALFGLCVLAFAAAYTRESLSRGAPPRVEHLTLAALIAAPALLLGILGVLGFSVRRELRLEAQGPFLLTESNPLGAPRIVPLPRASQLVAEQLRGRYRVLLRCPEGEEHPLASGPGHLPPGLRAGVGALTRALARAAPPQRGSGSSSGAGPLAR